jgi:hypothetical protein
VFEGGPPLDLFQLAHELCAALVDVLVEEAVHVEVYGGAHLVAFLDSTEGFLVVCGEELAEGDSGAFCLDHGGPELLWRHFDLFFEDAVAVELALVPRLAELAELGLGELHQELDHGQHGHHRREVAWLCGVAATAGPFAVVQCRPSSWVELQRNGVVSAVNVPGPAARPTEDVGLRGLGTRHGVEEVVVTILVFHAIPWMLVYGTQQLNALYHGSRGGRKSVHGYCAVLRFVLLNFVQADACFIYPARSGTSISVLNLNYILSLHLAPSRSPHVMRPAASLQPTI